MNLLSILEIGILVSFSAFFVFWIIEINRMRRDIASVNESMKKAVEILKEISNSKKPILKKSVL